MAPQAVASIPVRTERGKRARSILAVGGDLKNAPMLVSMVRPSPRSTSAISSTCRAAKRCPRPVRDLCAIYGVGKKS